MLVGPVEVFGQYFVYEQLGVGGMARVDRAELAGSEGFHRPVALKRMLPHVAADQDMVKAFVREARLASHLRHANVAQTYEFGKVDDIYFIAMELVTGPTLRDLLKHCAQTTGPMPVPIALNILNQICDALDHAHNLCDESGQPLGIVHRDVSPSNIIIDEAGVVKLIDFGVAKASAAGMQTTSGMIKGKFGYMAPEYLVSNVDARADLFAVGVIAHELLTNRPLFSVGDDMETLRRLRSMPLRPPSRDNPGVPPEIDDLVMTALSRDPDHRWQHATALRAALTTLTQRLGLRCTNQQVVEWIAWAFDHTRPHGTDLPAADEAAVEPSVQIEQLEQPTLLELPSSRKPTASGRQLATAAPPSLDDETELRAPDDALSLTDATELRAPDDALSLTDATELRTPDDALSLTDATELHPAPPSPGPRTRPMGAAPEDARAPAGPRLAPRARSVRPLPSDALSLGDGHHATLLDGGAALRRRTPAPEPGKPLPLPLLGGPVESAPPPRGSPRPASAPQGPSESGPPPRPSSRPGSAPSIPWSQALLPAQPLPLQPLPSDPRRGTTAFSAPRSEAAPGRRTTHLVLVLLAAGLAAAAVYLVLLQLV